MWVVVHQLKIFEFKIENIFYSRIDQHFRKRSRFTRQLQFRLFNVDYEFTNFLAVPLQDASYWEAHIPMGSLPTNLVSLEVWALDSLQHKAARFPEKVKVPRRPMPM